AGEIEYAFPLSAYQRELFRHRNASPPKGLYVQNIVTKIRSATHDKLDLDVVSQAWRAVAQRHPTFRASFQWTGLNEPFQVVHRHHPLDIERYDVSALDADAYMERIHQWVIEGRERGFVLDRPGHVRIGLFQTSSDEVYMVWLYNYMFSDGWSVSFLL